MPGQKILAPWRWRTGDLAGISSTGIEGAERPVALRSQVLLPLGFDQMKRILSATAGHRAADNCVIARARAMVELVGAFVIFKHLNNMRRKFEQLVSKT